MNDILTKCGMESKLLNLLKITRLLFGGILVTFTNNFYFGGMNYIEKRAYWKVKPLMSSTLD